MHQIFSSNAGLNIVGHYAMAKLQLESPWLEVKDKLLELNSDLCDADLDYEPGKEDELLEKLAKKMNRTIPEIKGWIESVSATSHIAS